MKNASLFVILVALAGCTSPEKTETLAADNASGFTIKRGTNIAHWLSQSDRRGVERANFFTQKDIAFIDSAGFDHIRLPVDEEQLWDSLGGRHDDAFALLDSCLSWAEAAGLRVVLDLHILRSHYFNAKEKPLWKQPAAQDKFIQLWKDLSSAVKNIPIQRWLMSL